MPEPAYEPAWPLDKLTPAPDTLLPVGRRCSIPGCPRPHEAKGYCVRHYQNWRTSGRAEPLTLAEQLECRFVRRQSGCWEWVGSLDRNGYGRYGNRAAHRVVYELLVAKVPAALDLDHLCRNHPCVNPAHLEPVTRKVNLNRGLGHGSETHCPAGHPYDQENTLRQADGSRKCRRCARRQRRERYLRNEAPQAISRRAS